MTGEGPPDVTGVRRADGGAPPTRDGPPDVAAVERAAAGRALRFPRVPHRGRLGAVRAASVGSSMELHDFRAYHPGDDLRHVDWNAVARTGELVVRVRQDEVSPRVEVVLDASASMAVSAEKAARAKELALWVCELSRNAGGEATLLLAGGEGLRVTGPGMRPALLAAKADGRAPFDVALARLPPLRPCGVRVVVSDFLVEAPPGPLAERLARDAASAVFVQVLDADDVDPPGGAGARLTDAETGEVLERLLDAGALAAYRERLAAHVAAWQGAARRVSARWLPLVASATLDELARRELSWLAEGT
ncbi:MAG: DUF58 domain-containing protein [Myxococcaceae bacterium]|jgi:uncharacterized protein (DUF58 family)|nr:DUF58 domain-containing protein [Myxococcaceae bacterium]